VLVTRCTDPLPRGYCLESVRLEIHLSVYFFYIRCRVCQQLRVHVVPVVQVIATAARVSEWHSDRVTVDE
jgi:hypothetical protein